MSWFSALFGRKAHEQRLDSELRFHLEQQIRDNIAAGMDPGQARREAAIEFGGVEQIKEECRDLRKGQWLETSVQDLRYGIRALCKTPGFTIVALATLALGIGVNTTTFTVLNRLLLQSLPFRDPDRIVQIGDNSNGQGFYGQSPGDYFEERDQNTVFDKVAAYYPSGGWSYTEPGKPAVLCLSVSSTANFFSLMGIEAQIGRTFTEEEQKRFEPLTVISNLFWRQHFGSDPKILGQPIRLNSKMYTIIGVLPPALDDPTLFGGSPDVFPLDPTDINKDLRDTNWYRVAARLKPGVTIKQAQAEMTVLAQRMAHDHPKTNQGRGLTVQPYPTNSIGETGAELAWLVMALSGMVLLIACVNLANLQLVRTTRRAPEIAIRLAIGCPRGRLIGMLLVESVVLSVMGGALGLLVAKWSNSYIASYFNFDMPLDGRVIVFTFAISLITGTLFGTVPALIASNEDVNASLKSGGRAATADRSRHLLRKGLVVVELAMALTLLAGAGFFVSGIYKITHRDLGWSAKNVIVGYIAIDHDQYGEQKDPRSVIFSDRLREALQAIPGVTAATISRLSPARGLTHRTFRVEGQPAPQGGAFPFAQTDATSPGFFQVFGVPLVKGRDFNDTDRQGSPNVVIVNEAMAAKFWPGQDPIGKRIGEADPANPNWAEVVGVMKGFRAASDFFPIPNGYQILQPWAQNNQRFMSFNLRASVPVGPLKESARKAIANLAPDVAPVQLATATEAMDAQMSIFNFVGNLLLEISALGLLLASVGIYGVVANLAAERTKEIGIRMALGAEPGRLIWLFLKGGMQLALVGTAAGLGAAFALLHILTKMLPIVPGNDPCVVACVALILILIAVMACWLPAWRASKVSPTTALRAE
jgi:predicted permease